MKTLSIFFLITLLTSCVTKKEIEAALWLNTGLPKDVCEEHAETLKRFGAYRKLDDGTYQIVSYCKKEIKDFYSIQKDDLKRLIDKAQGR